MNGAEEELAYRIADARIACHPDRYPATNYGDDDVREQVFKGVWGEMHFARMAGFPYTYKQAAEQVNGDGGIDFAAYFDGRPMTIDVKTCDAKTAFNLLVKEHQIETCADVLVMAVFNRKLITFAGWETREVMGWMRVAKFGHPQANYFRPVGELRPMGQLMNILAGRDATPRQMAMLERPAP